MVMGASDAISGVSGDRFFALRVWCRLRAKNSIFRGIIKLAGQSRWPFFLDLQHLQRSSGPWLHTLAAN
jgi:hypothetical protein